MAFANNTPPIDVVGAFVLRTPFVATPGENYQCQSIRGFQEIIAQGEDPKVLFYDVHGIQGDYDADALNAVNIVTLLSDNEDPIYVPSSYIISFPTTTTVPYSRTLVTADLGLLPDSVEILDFITHVAQGAALVSGMNPNGSNAPLSATGVLQAGELAKFVKISTISVEGGVSFTQHEVSNNFRNARLRDAELISYQQQLAAMQKQLLEKDQAAESMKLILAEWEPIVAASRI